MDDPSLAALVSDGAYSDLIALLELPSWASSPLYGLQRLAQRQRSGDGGDAEDEGGVPLELARRCYVPAFFVHGAADEIVPPSHAEALRKNYGGEAQLLLVPDGAHDTPRPAAILARVTLFLFRAFRREGEAEVAAEVQRLERMAISARSLPPLPPPTTSDVEVRDLLAAHSAPQRRCGLLMAAVAACPAHLHARFEPVHVPSRGEAAGTLLKLTGSVAFLSAESEATIAWAVDSGHTGGGGVVIFAVLSPSLQTITRVRLTHSAAGAATRDADGCEIAGLSAEVETLAISEGAVPATGVLTAVALSVHASGPVDLSIGTIRLSADLSSNSEPGGATFSSPLGISAWTNVFCGAAPSPQLRLMQTKAPSALRSPRAAPISLSGGPRGPRPFLTSFEVQQPERGEPPQPGSLTPPASERDLTPRSEASSRCSLITKSSIVTRLGRHTRSISLNVSDGDTASTTGTVRLPPSPSGSACSSRSAPCAGQRSPTFGTEDGDGAPAGAPALPLDPFLTSCTSGLEAQEAAGDLTLSFAGMDVGATDDSAFATAGDSNSAAFDLDLDWGPVRHHTWPAMHEHRHDQAMTWAAPGGPAAL